MDDRSAWSRRHPWLAGFEWSSMMTPLWAFMGFASGAALREVVFVSAVAFLGCWLLFSWLLLRQFRGRPV